MPNSYIQHLSAQDKVNVEVLEQYWEKAKKIVDKNKNAKLDSYWGLVMHIFQNIYKSNHKKLKQIDRNKVSKSSTSISLEKEKVIERDHTSIRDITWWKKLPITRRADYIKQHPGSKFLVDGSVAKEGGIQKKIITPLKILPKLVTPEKASVIPNSPIKSKEKDAVQKHVVPKPEFKTTTTRKKIKEQKRAKHSKLDKRGIVRIIAMKKTGFILKKLRSLKDTTTKGMSAVGKLSKGKRLSKEERGHLKTFAKAVLGTILLATAAASLFTPFAPYSMQMMDIFASNYMSQSSDRKSTSTSNKTSLKEFVQNFIEFITSEEAQRALTQIKKEENL